MPCFSFLWGDAPDPVRHTSRPGSHVVLLEDDQRRIEAMVRVVKDTFSLPLIVHRSAPEAIAWLEKHLEDSALLALDHDLGPSWRRSGTLFDPGIGRHVANWLAEREPVCPVVIHSSNGPAANGMQNCLEAAGWTVGRVFPFDELEWIERDWTPLVQQLLAAFELNPASGDPD